MGKSTDPVIVRTRATGRVAGSEEDVDIASRILKDAQASDIPVDDATSARLVKSIDRNMMPVSFVDLFWCVRICR